MKETFYSQGKLLLTAEYVVLDNALALAVPTKFGQFLNVEKNDTNSIVWKSYTNTNTIWFEAEFKLENNLISCSIENDISKNLIKILKAAKSLNPEFLNSEFGFNVTSKLEFPQNWGLGSSSTLLNNIANWAKIDAFKLSNLTFGGSGYDIACAQNSSPIFYNLENTIPTIKPITFNPEFKNHLYFVHLNQKQNSRDGIKHYKAQQFDLKDTIIEISGITKQISGTTNFNTFCNLITKHETLISNITKQETVKNRLFKDFNGSIKSLGAWGGDFVLITSKENPKPYFESKGFDTVLSWDEMILS
ncbi:GYDIA family GHMP kinase [Aurantibacter sp.]|uniref:GYDIA family GHMP kinase n=1 Tax=Aurantibacter sp. TaxID=2807103 RepID=UPI0035C7D79C